jgi:hypothetical protein
MTVSEERKSMTFPTASDYSDGKIKGLAPHAIVANT